VYFARDVELTDFGRALPDFFTLGENTYHASCFMPLVSAYLMQSSRILFYHATSCVCVCTGSEGDMDVNCYGDKVYGNAGIMLMNTVNLRCGMISTDHDYDRVYDHVYLCHVVVGNASMRLQSSIRVGGRIASFSNSYFPTRRLPKVFILDRMGLVTRRLTMPSIRANSRC
jgi:hypothetical protein